jgi:hypothetical protein
MQRASRTLLAKKNTPCAPPIVSPPPIAQTSRRSSKTVGCRSPRAQLLMRLEQTVEVAKEAWRESTFGDNGDSDCPKLNWAMALAEVQRSLEEVNNMILVEVRP